MAEVLKTVYEAISNKKEDSSQKGIESKDFVWDQFIKYISSAILALTVINFTVDFLQDGGVICFPPSDTADLVFRMEISVSPQLYTFTIGQGIYLNNYCAKSVPIAEFFPIYILVQGLLLIVPHYIWGAINQSDFDSYFAIADKFDRLRDPNTGEYHTNNFDRMTKLELEYGGTKRTIFTTYILKLFIQLCVCVGSIVFSTELFIDFSFTFKCPKDISEGNIPDGWPLNTTVDCVYSSLRVLNLIQYADFILIGLAAVLLLYGLAWCVVRHTNELGHVVIAMFSFKSCLTPDRYVFPPAFSWRSSPCFAKCHQHSKIRLLRYLVWAITHFPCPHVKNWFSPRICNDFDFLLMRLFRADSSHGKVFKDMQINHELKAILSHDHQLLHLYRNIQSDVNVRGVLPQDIDQERKRQILESLGRSKKEFNAGQTQHQDDENHTCFQCIKKLFSSRDRNRGVTEPGTTEQTSNENTSCQQDHKIEFEITDSQSHSSKSTPPSTGTSGHSADQGNSAKDEIDGVTWDLHSFFLGADFSGNPERITHTYFKPHLGNVESQEDDFIGNSLRDWIYWYVTNCGPKQNQSNAPRNFVAMEATFGSTGYFLVLARAFRQVFTINFHPFYRNYEEAATQEKFYTNYASFKFPQDVYACKSEVITTANGMVFDYLNKKKIDFILIGPLTDKHKRVNVNLLLNMLYIRDLIGEDALLLTVRPLRVGSRKLTTSYFKYEPPRQLFDHEFQRSNDVVEKLDKKQPSATRLVDDLKGNSVSCGEVPCIFEFIPYKFKEPPRAQNDINAVTDSGKHFPETRINQSNDSCNGTLESCNAEVHEHNSSLQPLPCTRKGVGHDQTSFQSDSRESTSISGAHANVSSVSTKVCARADRSSDPVNQQPSLDKTPRKSSTDSGLFSPSTDGPNKLPHDSSPSDERM